MTFVEGKDFADQKKKKEEKKDHLRSTHSITQVLLLSDYVTIFDRSIDSLGNVFSLNKFAVRGDLNGIEMLMTSLKRRLI